MHVGYEPFHIFIDKKGNTTNVEQENHNKIWCHKNNLKVKNDSFYLDRQPVSKIGNELYFSALDGGFYYYKGIITQKEGKPFLDLTQVSCDYCPIWDSKDLKLVLPDHLFGKLVGSIFEINGVKFDELQYSDVLLRS